MLISLAFRVSLLSTSLSVSLSLFYFSFLFSFFVWTCFLVFRDFSDELETSGLASRLGLGEIRVFRVEGTVAIAVF